MDVEAKLYVELARVASEVASEHAALAALDVRRALVEAKAHPARPHAANNPQEMLHSILRVVKSTGHSLVELERRGKSAREACAVAKQSHADALVVMRSGGPALASELLRECDAAMRDADATCAKHDRPEHDAWGSRALSTPKHELVATLHGAEEAAAAALLLLASCARAARATLLSTSVADDGRSAVSDVDEERSVRCALAALRECAPTANAIEERCRAAPWTALYAAGAQCRVVHGELEHTVETSPRFASLVEPEPQPGAPVGRRREWRGHHGAAQRAAAGIEAGADGSASAGAPPPPMRPMAALLRRIEAQMLLVGAADAQR